ncbi:MAG: PTS glucose transporter subunit IIB [Metamycoplasmataceae bacterium]
MDWKQKFMFIFLQVITFGLIWIYWKKFKTEKNDTLIQDEKITINVEKILEELGGYENIINVIKTYSKLKIFFKKKELINVENIKEIKGVSGIFINDKSIDLIVGPQSGIIYDKYFALKEVE